jgi:uncharacterized membrane protein affecting hemolysin expression
VIDEIKAAVEEKVKVNWPFKVEIFDEENVLIAEVEKIVYVRKKTALLKTHQTATS